MAEAGGNGRIERYRATMKRKEITETALENLRGMYDPETFVRIDAAFDLAEAHFAAIEPIDVQAIYVSRDFAKKLVPKIEIKSRADHGYLCKIFGTYLWMDTDFFESNFAPYMSQFECMRYEREQIDKHVERMVKLMSCIDSHRTKFYISKMLEDKAKMTTLTDYYN